MLYGSINLEGVDGFIRIGGGLNESIGKGCIGFGSLILMIGLHR